MKKPRILVIGSSLKDKGGIVTVIKNIQESSNDLFVLHHIETYITGSIFKRLYIFIQALTKLLWSLVFFKPDIIHMHMAEKGSFYRKVIILFITKLFNQRVILHIHSASFDEFYNSNNLQKKLIKFSLNKADRLIVLSEKWRSYYSNIVPLNKISVLYNGVLWNKEQFTRKNAIPIGLFLGRLGTRKGVYDLLYSIKEIKGKGIKGKFYLAGDGEIDLVKQKIVEYDISDVVEVLGWVNSEQVNSLLKEVDFLVLPSYNEGLPMSILESMNFGLPIVTTNVGGIPEAVINKENGFVINPGDKNALSVAINLILDNPKLRILMGENNRDVIKKKFDMNILMKDLFVIYKKIMKS